MNELPSSVKQWLDALRSGAYKQNRKMLRGPANKFCCLGVACDISGKGDWRQRVMPDSPLDTISGYYVKHPVMPEDEDLNFCTHTLPYNVQKWLKLNSTTGCFHELQVINGETVKSLACLNDILEWSFEEIADFIENNWQLMSTFDIPGPFTIAIDGPAAAGKGTLGRALASRYGFGYLDTGLLYRAVAGKIGANDSVDMMVELANSLSPKDLELPHLHTSLVSERASEISAIPEVREALLEYQKRFARRPEGAILDGRDIGTVIAPDADVKIFLTADIDTRVQRRHSQERETAILVPPTLDEVNEAMTRRDYRDAQRANAPLKMAEDAIMIDTTNLDIHQMIAKAHDIIWEVLNDV